MQERSPNMFGREVELRWFTPLLYVAARIGCVSKKPSPINYCEVESLHRYMWGMIHWRVCRVVARQRE